MSSSISLHDVLKNPNKYTLTEAGKEVVGGSRIDMKLGITTLILGIIGVSFMLGWAAGLGNHAFSNLVYWKCMAFPVAIMGVGLGFMGFGEYTLRKKLSPEQQKAFLES